MEPWEKDLVEIIETVADEVEHFFQGINNMVDSFFELTEEITDQIQNSIVTDLMDQWLDVYWDMEDMVSDIDPGFPYSVEATKERNPACIGCNNYHGQVYGGNLLVCGMHPHGWDDENCPDWESSSIEF
ncbi:MAG: hypothetical protein F6K62_00230 [Sphaerospermopsis sp. SIO1G2]|nr:hypothetical protein [Sphaerospermopsis sp. SIO1G1]NET69525.1 hypothetical protein [Sphaerospermopsis sp. SIO1G2]